jgi:hypothetical protein
MSKKLLQAILVILGAIPLVTGTLTLLQGIHALDAFGVSLSEKTTGYIILDSEMRFLGAIWAGIGVMVYTIVPTIEKQTLLFRLIMTAIILGGVGRVLSLVWVGNPPALFIALIVLELVGMPLLVLWQSHFASNTGKQT